MWFLLLLLLLKMHIFFAKLHHYKSAIQSLILTLHLLSQAVIEFRFTCICSTASHGWHTLSIRVFSAGSLLTNIFAQLPLLAIVTGGFNTKGTDYSLKDRVRKNFKKITLELISCSLLSHKELGQVTKGSSFYYFRLHLRLLLLNFL